MTCATVLNVSGLLMNLVGVILLFSFGMPYRIRTGGVVSRIVSGRPIKTHSEQNAATHASACSGWYLSFSEQRLTAALL